jgi:hypothetical protein
MKIQIHPKQKLDGGAMLAVAILAVVVGATLAAYLLLVQGEYSQVSRSQSWNSSMVVAESGVEDAMGLINQYEAAGNFPQLTNWYQNLNGWTDLGGNLYTNSRPIFNGGVKIGEYHVIIDNSPSNVVIITNLQGNYRTNTAPVINAMGVASWMNSTALAPAPMFAQAGGLAAGAPRRAVQIQTTFSLLFKGAMTTVDQVTFGGSGVLVDSFDSRDPAHSVLNTNFGYGVYDPSQASSFRKANGNIYTDGSLVGSISGGNSSVYGSVDTGPGGTATLGPNGTVGNVSYVNNPLNNGTIQSGYSSDDMNVTFPPVSLPSGWVNIATTKTQDTILNNPNANPSSNPVYYQITSLTGNVVINGQNVVIYFPNGFSLGGSGNSVSYINVNTNASATIYTGGDISTKGNGAINNLTQNSLNLAIYGLASVSKIDLGGNAAFTGTIYAPTAAFSFDGGGNNNYDFVGSVTAYSATLKGGAQFHFDENLLRNGPASGYIPQYWKEIVTH